MPSEIAEAFQKILCDDGDRTLIVQPGIDVRFTARAIAAGAAAIGRALDAARVCPGALVAAAIGNRPPVVQAFLACLTRGTPFLPLDGGTTPAEIGAVGRQFGAGAVLLAGAQDIPGFSRVTTIDSTLAIAIADVDPGVSRHRDAVVLKMTSGSTGTPRATITSEAVLVADTRNLMSTMDVRPDDVQLAAIPLSHAYGFGSLLTPILLQGTAIVMRDTFVPHRLPDDARKFGARVLPGVPFMFAHLAANPPADGWPAGLTRLLNAGAPLEQTVAAAFRCRFGIKIHTFYGTSETGGISFDGGDHPTEDGLVGRPMPNVTITFVPHEGAPAGGGRVHVRSPAVIQRYADDSDPEVFADQGFLTGDLGHLDALGQLRLSGRVSSFVNVAGRKVLPDEVERVLRGMPGVTDVRVVGVADTRRGEQLVACLVVRGARTSALALRQFCALHLAAHKIPRFVLYLESIPLTERGKTDRRQLERLVADELAREIRTI